MKRVFTALLVPGLLAWWTAAPTIAAPPAVSDADIPLDPNIAKASAEADQAAGTTESPPSGGAQTPYERALLNYKSAKYDAAKVLIDEADQEKPGDVPVEMLKARILMELHDFQGARQVLNSLYDRADLTPDYAAALELASGDLSLRQRHFDAAAKAYESSLRAYPDNADTKLKLIYARLGMGDLVTAGKLASELKPMDAASPTYYFAHAALAHSGAESGDEEQDIQQARTIYGITLTNRYLKTYLELFSNEKGGTNAATNSPTAAPSGKAP